MSYRPELMVLVVTSTMRISHGPPIDILQGNRLTMGFVPSCRASAPVAVRVRGELFDLRVENWGLSSIKLSSRR